jgi:hypothetical protein
MLRRTLAIALLLACGRASAQYLGPPQDAPPPPPPPAGESVPDEEVPPPAPVPPAPPVSPAGSPAPATAAAAEPPEVSLRRVRVWANLGATWTYGTTYVNLGAGVGYVVYAGLLPTFDVSFSFGASPTILMLKPGLDWFLPLPGRIRPYVGAYYAHWFVGAGYADQDALGARGGFAFAQAGPMVLLLGIAYEHVFTNCYGTCSYWVPQIIAGFAL